PPALGVLVGRLLETSLTIIGLHHVDRPSPQKWLALRKRADGGAVLTGNYELSVDEQRRYRRILRQVVRQPLAVRCVPLSIMQTGAGSSIHYAGTLPISDDGDRPLATAASGKLNHTRCVFLADSAPWTFLPAKGPTFTLMANARRVVDAIHRQLQSPQ